MKDNDEVNPSDFRQTADAVFGTLLTITTILSGIYVSITFGWFGQAMTEPHPGEPMSYEMLAFAISGITLGLVFILPLIFILLSWAFSKFRNSSTWGTAAWSGLIYCLAQDFIGIIALFFFSLIAAGAIVGVTLFVAGAFVLLIPPIFGTLIGYRIGMKYNKSEQSIGGIEKRQAAVPAVAIVFLILAVQVLLVITLFR